MAVTNGWGQAAVNNTNGYGKGAINATNDWGEVYADSSSGDTNIGVSTTPAFSNTYSVLLDGVDDFINCGSVDLNGLAASSFSCWFKASAVTKYLFSQWGASADQQMLVYLTPTGIDISINGSVRFRVAVTIPLNSWNHLAITFEGHNTPSSDRTRAYLNNVQLTGNVFGGATTFKSGVTSDFVIGARTSYNFLELAGYVDEFSVWSGELTSGNISDIYNSGAPNDISGLGISGLTHWWRMGDNNAGTGVTVTDMAGSRNATLKNSPTFQTDVP